MARVAETKGVSMLPEDRARWERLQGSRRTSDFVRELLDREEEMLQKGDPTAALARIILEQANMPAAWSDDAAWEAESAGADVSAIPTALTDKGSAIDVGSARKSGMRIGAR